jgi:hypothetical protein
MQREIVRRIVFMAALLGAGAFITQGRALAHCDTMDGPIVPEAQQALASGDLTPVLKWVPESDEGTIRDAFARARSLKGKGEEAEALAEQWFLETLIRVHRQAEGAGFTGLKPAGSMAPAFKAADEALDGGNVDALATEVSAAVRAEIEARFRTVSELRAHVDDSPRAGRRYVAAYVGYMHFVKGVLEFIGNGHGGEHGEDPGAGHGDHDVHGH